MQSLKLNFPLVSMAAFSFLMAWSLPMNGARNPTQFDPTVYTISFGDGGLIYKEAYRKFRGLFARSFEAKLPAIDGVDKWQIIAGDSISGLAFDKKRGLYTGVPTHTVRTTHEIHGLDKNGRLLAKMFAEMEVIDPN
jgi:hypothetical protein